ncbi:uncharacterized protein LOC135844359 [Planococcus citri]|uniref:uncharacterized protein LOC135844359 n=1 Tax=Planococcus citri TaxID=170843 RepID=UPI0031F9FC59
MPELDFDKKPYLKEVILLKELAHEIENASFTKQHVLISMGDFELNNSSIDMKYVQNYFDRIIRLLVNKQFKDILVIFPPVRPKAGDEPTTSFKRWLDFRHILLDVCSTRNVRYSLYPAIFFAEVVENILVGIKYTVACDENDNVIPDKNCFYLNDKGDYYNLGITGRERILEFLETFCDPTKRFMDSRDPVTITDLTTEDDPNARFVARPDGSLQHMTANLLKLIQEILDCPNKEAAAEMIHTLNQSASDSSDTLTETTENSHDISGMPDANAPETNASTTDAPHDSAQEDEQVEDEESQSSSPEYRYFPAFSVNMVNRISVNQEEQNALKSSSFTKVPIKVSEMNDNLKSQLLHERNDTITCVIPLRLGNSCYPAQLDSGAVPNIMSEETALHLIRHHSDELDFIELENPAVCILADSKEAETARYIIVPTLYFGKHALKIPFYVLKGCNHVFLIGTQSMEYLGIEPRIKRRKALCRPSTKVHTEVVDFLTPEQYEGKLNIFGGKLKDEYRLEMNNILRRTDMFSNYHRLPDGVIDDGPDIFIERLEADLQDAVTAGRITVSQAERAFDVLSEFRDVFSKFPGKYTGKRVRLKFNIPTKDIRYRGAKYNPSKKLMNDLRKELQVMMATNVIEPSDSTYINPIVVNVKKSGEIRVCLNPVDLNPILAENYNEAGLLDRIITQDAEAKLFCTLDFVSGFWQLVMDEFSRKYCAFQVDGRVYQFIRLPYGLKISSALFVNMVNDIIPDKAGITKYVDDILLRSATFEYMLELLVEVLTILRINNLRLNAKKTTFFKGKTEHLGFDLSPGRISKQSCKIDKFNDYIAKHTKRGQFVLKNKIEILELIGLTGLYRRFIPQYQQIIAPLYELTCDNVPFEWGPRQDAAIEKLKQEYTKDFELVPARDKIDLYLDTYTSNDAMNAVLYQNYQGQDEIILFTSHSFKPHQKKYTLIEREMYTLAKSIKKLQLWLHGRTIHVRSDLLSIVHKFETIAEVHRKAAGWITLFNCYNLIYDLRRRHKKWFGMQAPELTINSANCSNFITEENDLSLRIRSHLLDYLNRLSLFQKRDPKCADIFRRLKTPDEFLDARGVQIKNNLAKRYSIEVIDNKETLIFNYPDESRVPVLPDEIFKDMILFLHETYGHVGANKLEAIFRRMYYSSNAKHFIRSITSECLHCKANKTYSEKKPLEFGYTNSYGLADVISVDILGPISNYSNQPKYLLVSKDVFSGKVWLSLLQDILQQTVANAMEAVIKEIHSKKYKIRKIITDNATQFTNKIWRKLLKKYKIAIGHSTAHNPQSNLVERTMRIIGDRLRIKMNINADGAYSHHGWSTYVKEIEEEINNTPNDDNVPPDEVWQIAEFETDLPTGRLTFNAKYHLRKLLEKKERQDLPSITSEDLMNSKLDLLNNVYTSVDNVVWVSIDGACANNGSDDAIAGIGICWHPEGKQNVSERIKHENYTPTNNLAEAIALLTAMKIAIKQGITRLHIISDSRYLTSAVNDTFSKWTDNDWKNSAKKPVHHQEIFKEIIQLKSQFDLFELTHVYARETDFGNFTADRLARKAVYTTEFDIAAADKLTNHQALIRYIKEQRELDFQSREQKHNKRFGDPRIFKPGELVMITNHRLSSADKGASAKLFPKRFGPYVVVAHSGKNCYEVQKVADKSDKRLINVRQITTYLNLHHLKQLREEPKLRSKYDDRSLQKRMKQFAEHRDLLENFIKELEAPSKKKTRKFSEMNDEEKLDQFTQIRKRFRKKNNDYDSMQFDAVLSQVFPDEKTRENIQQQANLRYNMRKRENINYNEGTDAPEDGPRTGRRRFKHVNSLILNLLNHEQRMKFVELLSELPDWSQMPSDPPVLTC